MVDRIRHWLSRYRRCHRLGLSPVGAVRYVRGMAK